MASLLLKLGVPLILASAVFYQTILKDFLSINLGIGRHLQPISDFPAYQCRRIEDPILQACEDMWFSESTRQLFLACSDPQSRKQWMPNIGRFNASGRALDDAIIAMDVDSPQKSSYLYRILDAPGDLHLLGLTGVDSAQGINLFLVNAKPSLDPSTGDPLDNAAVGANSTIERFVLAPPHASELKHIRTFSHENITTPNNIAAMGKNAFYFTNDHGAHQTGWQHHLSPLRGTGDVSYCTSAKGCHTVATGLKFPNGLIRDPRDGYVYVPSSADGSITVFRPLPDYSLEKVDVIETGYPIDNLSQDSIGDIWAAAIPKAWPMLKAYNNPLGPTPPSTILRVRRRADGSGWDWEKVLEDAEGEVLPATTTAIHDAQTGRIFLSGVFSPFISVCEKKAL
ncbi:hypothetical protein LTR36_002561 [Oleoguttula mirabilis]|uniref:Serum paraoxonase/arylesterase n=1 Tax=Oleoguttula mirabilis TaxID=1507867 RepID=A0AAV9JKY7_9PEZI|nr:hypothetical protein LTR36_002561 [Oleoguttula mirabilis]